MARSLSGLKFVAVEVTGQRIEAIGLADNAEIAGHEFIVAQSERFAARFSGRTQRARCEYQSSLVDRFGIFVDLL
jgi:hypothetical protein